MSVCINPYSRFQIVGSEAGNVYFNGSKVNRVYINDNIAYDLLATQCVIMMVWDRKNLQFYWVSETAVPTDVSITVKLTSAYDVKLTIPKHGIQSPAYKCPTPTSIPINDQYGLFIVEATPQFYRDYWFLFGRDWIEI